MYGQITTMNQIMNAYFQITFHEWNWVFIDGIWPIFMAYTLPLSRAAKKLAQTRPTASVLGPQTVSSVVGVFFFHLIFTVVALFLLFNTDWFPCRKWTSTDVSNVSSIGDNYEAQVIWLVTGYQYISSAFAYSYSYEFRQAWFRNYIFVLLAFGFTAIHFYITLVPGKLSCLVRVNCENENVVPGVTTRDLLAIQNPFNATLMPEKFRWNIAIIMAVNAVVVCAYEYFIVNGIRRKSATEKIKKVEEEKKLRLERAPSGKEVEYGEEQSRV